MLKICAENSVRLVVPTIDTELPKYAAHRAEFERIGTTVTISAPATIDIGCDKDATFKWLISNGFPTVHQTTPNRLLSGKEDLSIFSFPLLVKPRGGSASIGVAQVCDLSALEAAVKDGDFIVQTIAKGVEHTVDVWVDKAGRCRCAVPRRRLEVRAGEVSKAITVKNEALMDVASRIAETLPGAFGVLNIQAFWDPHTNAVAIIEINPRFGGGYPLAWKAGADYPRWLIQESLGLPTDVPRSGWRDGLVMLRYDEAVFIDSKEAGL
jgi:carbamoyl-phosphate synthase large subunit